MRENIKNKDTKEEDKSSEIIPQEVLNAIPEEDRGRVQGVVRQMMISSSLKSGNPIAEKITSEHITDLIKNSDTQDKRDREERKTEKNYQIVFLLIGLLFVGFLIVFLKDSPDLLYKILIALFSFLGGFGIGRSRREGMK